MRSARRAPVAALTILTLGAAVSAQTLSIETNLRHTSSTTGAKGSPGGQTQPTTMKIYITVDMEGISGINGDDQLSPGQPEYGRARKLMAEDANAAIRGAFEAGATDVLVNDSHGGMRNLLPEDLDPRARLISHSFKRY